MSVTVLLNPRGRESEKDARREGAGGKIRRKMKGKRVKKRVACFNGIKPP